jgi:transcriptional regulator of acetoin/glycerol metabolism
MPARMQVALLRVLETGEYRPVGAVAPRRSKFRLISAALPRLSAMLETGQFRQDLFYRISTLKIQVPPLRDRDGDAAEIALSYARSLGFRLTAGAVRALSAYDWPGNVRQLRHCIQAASLHATDGRIGESAIADVLGELDPASGAHRDKWEVAWNRVVGRLEPLKKFGAMEFAQAGNVSLRSAQRHLARLVREGRIIRIGAGRATFYKLGPDARS